MVSTLPHLLGPERHAGQPGLAGFHTGRVRALA